MTEEYPKTQTIFKRDMANRCTLIEGCYSSPEIEYLKDNRWMFTEKVDGTNIRVHWERSVGVMFGGRTDRSEIPIFLIQWLEELFPLEKMDNAITTEVDCLCLYGEGFGARIQKGGGKYKSDGVDFIQFDVWIDGWWLRRDDVEDIADKLDIDAVPIVGSGTLQDGIEIVRHGLTSRWGDFIAEGLVFKPGVELKTRAGNRIITKIKGKDFC